MGKTTIEWTDASWNPIVGCTEISPGCANCYAARLAASRLRNTPQYKGLAAKLKSEIQFPNVAPHGIPEGRIQPRWTGEVRFLPERLEEPLHWYKPRRIFVCDMGDLFHETVDHCEIWSVFDVMQRCPQHTFQVLTKRADRMRAFVASWCATSDRRVLPNVWLGVSVENQHFANERIPLLLDTPAAVRWISAEPLLGSLNVFWFLGKHPDPGEHRDSLLDWVVCGGESGANARPMHPDWARSLRDQCQAAGVPFFFKQWGEFIPGAAERGFTQWPDTTSHKSMLMPAHPGRDGVDQHQIMNRVGKKHAGRLLDGREWNEFPREAAKNG